MNNTSKITIKVGDTVVVKHGTALGLGTVIAINEADYKDTYGQALVSWDSIGLKTHRHTALEVVDLDKLSQL